LYQKKENKKRTKNAGFSVFSKGQKISYAAGLNKFCFFE